MKLAIFAVIILVVFALLMVLPTISIDADAVIASGAFAWVRAAMYFIPTGAAAAILTIIAGLWIIRVVVALVKLIWDLLPVA